MESQLLAVISTVTHRTVFSHRPCAVLINRIGAALSHGRFGSLPPKAARAPLRPLPSAAARRSRLELKSPLMPRDGGDTPGLADQKGARSSGPWGLSGAEPGHQADCLPGKFYVRENKILSYLSHGYLWSLLVADKPNSSFYQYYFKNWNSLSIKKDFLYWRYWKNIFMLHLKKEEKKTCHGF